MICPRCSVAEIGAMTGACVLCGYVPDGSVAVDAPHINPTDELARAQLAHQFRLDALLGTGLTTAVYLARELDSSRHIVLKALPRIPGRPDSDARFRDAITAARGLDHPHLVPVLRNGETDSLLWYTMEHRRGRPLREMIRTTGPMDLKVAFRLLTQIAAALDYLHRRGAIHGRLKPENILVDADNWVFICDTMIARAFHATQPAPPTPPANPPRTSGPEAPRRSSGATFTPRVSDPQTARRASGASNTPSPPALTTGRSPFSAPEESTGLLGAASDQYALGAILYTMLAGAPPEPTADGRAFLPLGALRPNLPPHIEQAVARALSERPNDRFPVILDFVTALESGASMMREARPSGRASDLILTIPDWEPPDTPMTRWKKPALLSAIVVLVIGIVAVVMTESNTPVEPGFQMQPPPPPAAAPVIHDSTPSTTLTPNASGSLRISAPSQVRLGAEPLGPMQSDARNRRTVRSGRSGGRDSSASATPAPPAAASAPPSAPSAAPAAAPAAGGGTLFVNASPWGQVYLDGQLVGNTPKANLAVSAGQHTIRVQREGFNPVERSVHVGAGETVRVTDLVLTPHQ